MKWTRSRASAPVIFAIVAAAIFLIPAAIHFPVILGDNATQNISLRWLSAQLEVRGHLPAWDPFNWSGTPLASGFNAGAFYPLIFLFFVFPANWALSVTLAAVWFGAASLVYLLARYFGVRRAVAIPAGLVYAIMGAFGSQVVHIDMVEGDLGLLISFYWLLKLLDANDAKSRTRAATLVALGFGSTVLAGAPEAMLASLLLLATVLVVRLIQRKVTLPAVVALALAAIAALCLSAVQWLPGLSYTALSTRKNLPPHYAGTGPLAYKFFALFAFPFAYGSYSGTYLPTYFGNYNISEVTTSLGIVALVAICVALAQRTRPLIRPGSVSLLATVALVGIVFALGPKTPVAHLVYRLPLFNLQRLASRYSIVIDTALVLLAAVGVHVILEKSFRPTRITVVVVSVLATADTAFAIALLVDPSATFKAMHTSSLPRGTGLTEIRIYVAIQLVLILATAAVVLLRGSVARQRLPRILVIITAINLVNFIVLFYVAPAVHRPYPSADAPGIAKLIRSTERYGLYDPRLYLYGRAIAADAQLDRNVFIGRDSIQGYASLSLAGYNELTDTKTQSTLDPTLIGRYHRLLNMDLLITSHRYFTVTTPPGTIPAEPPLLDNHSWFTGGIRSAKEFTLTTPDRASSYLLTLAGPSVSYTTTIHGGRQTAVALPRRVTAHDITTATLVAHGGDTPGNVAIGMTFTLSSGYHKTLAGPLLNYLSPLHWRTLIGQDGTLDFVSRHPVSGYLHPSSSVTPLAQHQSQSGTVSLRVHVKAATRVTLALAYAPGWKANGPSGTRLSSSRGLITIGLVPGTYDLTLSYHAPRLVHSLELSLASLAAIGAWWVVVEIRKEDSRATKSKTTT